MVSVSVARALQVMQALRSSPMVHL